MKYLSLLLLLLHTSAWALDAPEPRVYGNQVTWAPVDAVTINVHTRIGAYITTLPGSATSWEANTPGDYYLVSTNDGEWQTWARSSSFRLEDQTLPGDCLLAEIPNDKVFCFTPLTRELIATLPDGNPYWRFTIPSDPERNDIRHLRVVNDQLVIIAELDPLIANSTFSLSAFEFGGAFQYSKMILTDVTNDYAINTDDRSLLVLVHEGAVLIAGEYYDKRISNNKLGSFVARVDVASGTTSAIKKFPARQLGNMFSVSSDTLELTINGSIATLDPVTLRIETNDPFNARLELPPGIAPADGKPSVPANLRVDLLSNNWVELNWAPSADDGEIVEYQIERNDGVIYRIRGDQTDRSSGSQAEIDKIWKTTSFIDCQFTRFMERLHKCEDNQPEIGGRYTYRISAIDDDGNQSAQSTPLTVQLYDRSGSPVEPFEDSYIADGDTFTFDTDFSRTDHFLDNFELVFNDEFNDAQAGASLDTEKWNTSLTWGNTPINGELQYYVDIINEPDFGYNPFYLTGTELWIEAIETPENLREAALGRDFLSGTLSTHNKFGFTYGYTEARIKVAGNFGALSSFYLMRRWNAGNSPEMDIIEYLGDNQFGDEDAFQVHHYQDVTYGTRHATPTMATRPPDGELFSDDYHVYGLLWEPRLVIWYIDGQEVKRISGPQVGRQSVNIIAYLVTGSDWAPRPSSRDFPMKMKIDYIRTYQRVPYIR